MPTRRSFVQGLCASAAVCSFAADSTEPIIDIHQHTSYSGRTNTELVAHQRRMGISRTILLPAGSKFELAVGAGGNASVVALARELPREFVFFANEVPGLPETLTILRKFLKQGAIGIGEQKFGIRTSAPELQRICDIAAEFGVPVLLHFQHDTYNLDYDTFHRILSKYPRVNFIGHAQTFWANIDRNAVQSVLYPKGPVTPGGITDRYLSDFPNFWGDLSAGSGLNALRRDEVHARDFLVRHQDRLLYGSDCNDKAGEGAGCSGSQMISEIRRLTEPRIRRKLLYENAARLFPSIRK